DCFTGHTHCSSEPRTSESFMSACRVLLIDDDVVCQHLVTAQLRAEGYEVHLVSSGLDAVELASILQPDVIVAEISHDDARTLEPLRLTPARPGIRGRAIVGPASAPEDVPAGAMAVLQKPFGLGGLGRLLRDRLVAHRRKSIPPLAWAS